MMSALPVQGLCPLAFLMIFFIIDKSDEYQLIIYILQFKGTQFISYGIIRTVLGFFLFISCVTAPAKGDKHKCDEQGPGSVGNVYIVIGGFLLQFSLVWIAFLLLPFSEERGRQSLKGS